MDGQARRPTALARSLLGRGPRPALETGEVGYGTAGAWVTAKDTRGPAADPAAAAALQRLRMSGPVPALEDRKGPSLGEYLEVRSLRPVATSPAACAAPKKGNAIEPTHPSVVFF